MLKKDILEFAESAAECLYDLNFLKIDKGSLFSSVEFEIKNLLDLNEEATLSGRHEHFNISGTVPDDYRELFYEVGPGKFVLAGIRHKSGDKDQPFVNALLGFLPVNDDISLLKEFVTNQFSKFSPKYLTVWLKPSVGLESLGQKVIQSRQYMVGSIEQIAQKEKPAGYDRISLKKVAGEFDYSWYKAAYDEFHQKQPELKSWVTINDQEDVERSIRDQLLFEVFVDGELAGLIGATNESLFGKAAVYMSELLLVSRFKGQGLATAVQRKFIDELPKSFEIIWGTIDAKNLPSLKTSLGVGRRSIRAEYFISL